MYLNLKDLKTRNDAFKNDLITLVETVLHV